MRSMTGYGRGETDHSGTKFSVELNSVNRKQSDIVINLPRDLAELEPRIRQTINENISRGRTNATITFHNGPNGARIICARTSLLVARLNSSRRKCFANSTRSARKQMMPLFHSVSSPARRSWRRFESKFKILSKRFSRYGILFVVSAPSGAGKTTLVEALRQTANLFYSVSCTTRAPRGGEIEGEDYQFLSDADF